jgi:hypothetical protein
MERRFLHDFSRVRVHADGAAAETAAAVQARAYTVGPHIAFARGAYDPGHRRRQATRRARARTRRAAKSDARSARRGDAEREAARAADEASIGRRVTPSGATPVRIARQPTTATAERELEVEAVEVAGQSYVLYQTEVRTAGSSAWLANNPGNMDYTPDLVEWGAYEGKKLKWGKHRFAIFPNEDTGLRAVQRFLRKHQGRRDITLMMNLFAPAGDLSNDPQLYAKRVATALGVPLGTLVQDLTDEQLAVFASTIKEVEGWKEGQTYRRGDPALPEAAGDERPVDLALLLRLGARLVDLGSPPLDLLRARQHVLDAVAAPELQARVGQVVERVRLGEPARPAQLGHGLLEQRAALRSSRRPASA